EGDDQQEPAQDETGDLLTTGQVEEVVDPFPCTGPHLAENADEGTDHTESDTQGGAGGRRIGEPSRVQPGQLRLVLLLLMPVDLGGGSGRGPKQQLPTQPFTLLVGHIQ